MATHTAPDLSTSYLVPFGLLPDKALLPEIHVLDH